MKNDENTLARMLASAVLLGATALYAMTFVWGVATISAGGQPNALLVNGTLRFATGDHALVLSPPPFPLGAKITFGPAGSLPFVVSAIALTSSSGATRIPLWPVLVALLVLALYAWGRKPRSYTPLKCAECGYDLRGLDQNRCPECGALFTRAKRAGQASGDTAHHRVGAPSRPRRDRGQ